MTAPKSTAMTICVGVAAPMEPPPCNWMRIMMTAASAAMIVMWCVTGVFSPHQKISVSAETAQPIRKARPWISALLGNVTISHTAANAKTRPEKKP